MRRLWGWLFGKTHIEWPEEWVNAFPRYIPPEYGHGYRMKRGELLTHELFNDILERLDRLEEGR